MDKGITIAHVADLHLGAGNLHGGITAEGLPERLIDFRRVWVEICTDLAERARAGKLHAVLFAGDGFRTRRPSPTEIVFFQDGLSLLLGAGLPVVAVPGNHDLPNTPGERSALDPMDWGGRTVGAGTFQVIRTPDVYRVECPGGRAFNVAGLPYFSRSWVVARLGSELANASSRAEEAVGNIVAGLASWNLPFQLAASQIPDVLMLHHSVTGSVTSTGYETATGADPTIPLDVLASGPWAYVACGHIHKLQDLTGGHGGMEAPPVVYPGTPERIDFGEESEPKGWVEATFTQNLENRERGRCFWEHHASNARPFLTVERDLRDLGQLAESEFVQHVAGQISNLRAVRGGLAPVLRLRYSVTSEQAPGVRPSRLVQAARDAGAFWVSTVEPTITGDSREVRVPGLSREIRPEAALEKWLAAAPELEPHAVRLLDNFRELYTEALHAR